MEEHVSSITALLNRLLGPLALQLLNALHIQPSNPALPTGVTVPFPVSIRTSCETA